MYSVGTGNIVWKKMTKVQGVLICSGVCTEMYMWLYDVHCTCKQICDS